MTAETTPDIGQIQLTSKLDTFVRTVGRNVIDTSASSGDLEVQAEVAFGVCLAVSSGDTREAAEMLIQLCDAVDEYNEYARGLRASGAATPFPAP